MVTKVGEKALLLVLGCMFSTLLVQANDNLELFKARGFVTYEDFDALGDGQHDDQEALAKAHAFANQHNLPVKATNHQARYYIGGGNHRISVKTNTDFGKAEFIIDDKNVKNRNWHIFVIESKLAVVRPKEIKTLKVGQRKLDLTLPATCVVSVADNNTKRFIRRGRNLNSGSAQSDVFLVDRRGEISPKTPIIWDFDQISSIVAYPMDETTLYVRGGRFVTLANRETSKYTYYARGIGVQRSNVVIQELEHRVREEGEQGAPYRGFLDISQCAFVIVRDCILHGHKTYRTIGRADKPVSMGSYDISVTKALHVSFINCKQFDDIQDTRRWGIMGSNFCKNLIYDGCQLSRFDAHQGVVGVIIRNSILGHMGINAIGAGRFLVQDSTVYGHTFINLRSDYGSTWQGEIVIKNCKFIPAGGRTTNASLIGGHNDGQHDFGYQCYMPQRIIIDGLEIDDTNHPNNYNGPSVLGNFNGQYKTAEYVEKFPYIKTQEIFLKNISTASGKPLQTSKNEIMFKDVRVKQE